MKYRYFKEYGKLLPLPEVLKPKFPVYNIYDKKAIAFQEWLSNGLHVPDEHLWYFEGVDRDESEFEKVWYNLGGFDRPDNYGWAAIPKAEESTEQEDSPIDLQQSKMGVCSGDWYLNENGNRITVLSVVDGWCMVREGDKKPFVVPEEFVLGTFDKSITQ